MNMYSIEGIGHYTSKFMDIYEMAKSVAEAKDDYIYILKDNERLHSCDAYGNLIPFSLIRTLAEVFSDSIKGSLSPQEMKEIIEINDTISDKKICASHDFIDANPVMYKAFSVVVMKNPDISAIADTSLWQQAWDYAKENSFFFDLGYSGGISR